MKKILISVVMIALIAPQVVLASWWNPFSWFKKSSSQAPTQTQTERNNTVQATSTATEIDILKKEIGELKKKQSTIQPTPVKLTRLAQVETKVIVPQTPTSSRQTASSTIVSSLDLESYKKFISNYEKSFRERVNGGLLSNKALQSSNNDSNALALNYAITAENNLNSAYQIISNAEIPNVAFSNDIYNFVDKYISYINLYIERAQIMKAMAMLPSKADFYPADLDKLRQLTDEYEKNIKLAWVVYQELWILQTKVEESAKNTFGIDLKFSREK